MSPQFHHTSKWPSAWIRNLLFPQQIRCCGVWSVVYLWRKARSQTGNSCCLGLTFHLVQRSVRYLPALASASN